MPPVNVLAVATAVPPHELEQSAVVDAARQVYAPTFDRYPKLADVFVNAGIERRYSARSLDWLSAPHDLAERTNAYLESASQLFIQTARAALDRAGISARDVDVVVTVSSTGIATPALKRASVQKWIPADSDARSRVWPWVRRWHLGPGARDG
jgi:alkylresorcinol/alkylpyrone synthase